MIKIIALFLLLTPPCFAQFDLNDSNVSASVKNEKSKETKKSDEKEDGIFSFMNFSFMKNKDVIKTQKTDEPLIKRLNTLAQKGDAEALSALGFIYLYGDKELNIEKDYSKAFEYYTKASEKNDVVAINNLANLYYSGLGVEKNKVAAAKLFQKAANLGNAEAMVNLAFMYLSGDGIAKNPKFAVSWFEKAAKQNNTLAKYMLGLAYYNGYEMPVDYNKAFNLVKEAAKKGFDEAQLTLAQLYMNGQGTPQNYGIAIGLLNSAVKQDNLAAMYNLANVLSAGTKFPRDLVKAHILYNLASVRGQYDAATRRDVIEKNLDIKTILQAQSQANSFVASPSEITTFVRKTFGNNVSAYMKKTAKN